MKMISYYNLIYQWYTIRLPSVYSQISPLDLPMVKHFYHPLHTIVLDKYVQYVPSTIAPPQKKIWLSFFHCFYPLFNQTVNLDLTFYCLTPGYFTHQWESPLFGKVLTSV